MAAAGAEGEDLNGETIAPSSSSAEPKAPRTPPQPYLEIETNVDEVINTPTNSSGYSGVDVERTDNGVTRGPKPYLEIDTTPEATTLDRKISLDLTPLSCKSNDSSSEYKQPNQTCIIFDWDDTLCPSTCCMRVHSLSVLGDTPSEELAELLRVHTSAATMVIERAAELGSKVVIVTNAEEGWVELSCKAWMAALLPSLERHCTVVSARSTWEPQGVKSPAGWKERAFRDVIDRFYSRYLHQSWKNVISVGDAPHEREALMRVMWSAPQKRCRSKSVKFIVRPSVQQLTRELEMLHANLRDIVWHDDDLDLHFSADTLCTP